MTEATPRRSTPLALFLLALAPRLALALLFLDAPIGLDDMHQYDMLGRSLAAGQGYRWYQREDVSRLKRYLDKYYPLEIEVEEVPQEGYATAHRPPGYPFFLASIYRLFGTENRFAVARMTQALLGASLAPLTWLLAVKLGLRGTAARFAGVLVACYPILCFYPLGLASENLFIPLLLVGMLLLLPREGEASLGRVVLAALALGCAALTRSYATLFIGFAGLWLWRSQGLRRALTFSLVASALIAPWAIRNSLLLGRPAFIENALGYNLFIGYHPQGDGGFETQIAVLPLRHIEDAAREAWAFEQAMGFVRANPWRVPGLVLRRMAYFVGLEDRALIYFYTNGAFGRIGQPWRAVGYALIVSPWLFLGLGVPFGWVRTKAGGARTLLVGLGLCTLFAHLPVLAEPRFHVPLVPLLAGYAGAAWTQVRVLPQGLPRIRSMDRPGWLALGVVLAFLLLVAWDTMHDWGNLMQAMGAEGHKVHLGY
jgi:hypothetical protein